VSVDQVAALELAVSDVGRSPASTTLVRVMIVDGRVVLELRPVGLAVSERQRVMVPGEAVIERLGSAGVAAGGPRGPVHYDWRWTVGGRTRIRRMARACPLDWLRLVNVAEGARPRPHSNAERALDWCSDVWVDRPARGRCRAGHIVHIGSTGPGQLLSASDQPTFAYVARHRGELRKAVERGG
jgi:hypothetical protein